MKNVLLTIAYDGTALSGWQRQPGRATAQGEIERSLARVLGRAVPIAGVSRTDAGVHALAQKASFQLDSPIPLPNLQIALNNILLSNNDINRNNLKKFKKIPNFNMHNQDEKILDNSFDLQEFNNCLKSAMQVENKLSEVNAGAIRITNIEEKPEGFHARFSCVGKKYVYKLDASENPSIFERNYYYQLKNVKKQKLDIEAMKKATTYIVGTHDFACFQAAGGTPRETTVRTIYSLDILGAGKLEIHIVGDGFLYNMVRIITGTLVDVGNGKIKPEQVKSIIEGKDRQSTGHTAPPCGLYLAEVYYDKTFLG